MSRGRRYNNEPKLNIKKVIAVIVAIAVIVMFVIAIKNLLNSESSSNNLVSTTYFLLNKNNKWGVIDNNAKIIIEPTYSDAIIIPNNKQDIFICTENTDYNKGTYNTKVLNANGKEILTQYDKVIAIENHDENNNLWYEDNVLLIEKDEKFGLVNFNGNEILEPNYEKIYTLKGIKDSLITEKDGKNGVVNNAGQILVENKYDEIKSLGKDTKLYIVKSNNKYGIEGILDCKYQDIKALNNKDIYCVKEDGKYKVINSERKTVFNEKFDNIETIKDNIIVYKYNNQYCAYNIETGKKLSKMYKTLKYTSNGLFIARTSNNYGLIDINGETKIKQEYANINYYEEVNAYELEAKNSDVNTILNGELKETAKGIINEVNSERSYISIWTEEGYKYYKPNGEQKSEQDIFNQNNLFLSKKDDKYGFIDKDGNVKVDYIYDDARVQNAFGYMAVKKDGLWGSLDKNGNIISNTKYDLEENLLIDFIGEYHLGKDLNLMYYTNK